MWILYRIGSLYASFRILINHISIVLHHYCHSFSRIYNYAHPSCVISNGIFRKKKKKRTIATNTTTEPIHNVSPRTVNCGKRNSMNDEANLRGDCPNRTDLVSNKIEYMVVLSDLLWKARLISCLSAAESFGTIGRC